MKTNTQNNINLQIVSGNWDSDWDLESSKLKITIEVQKEKLKLFERENLQGSGRTLYFLLGPWVVEELLIYSQLEVL